MTESPGSDESVLASESGGKKKKGKKRPSDFEIVRTILQRSHERKLPYLMKNMGEDADIFLFCSQEEEGFTYGSPDLSIAMFEFTDPELSEMVRICMSKMYGLSRDHGYQCVINVRDQMSELAKTKGETIEVVVEENDVGSSWTTKVDVKGQSRTLYYSSSVESLFHFQLIKTWCERYRPLLTTQDPHYLFYPYRHPESDTATIIALPPVEHGDNHPIARLYPHGFRAMVTKGLDVIVSKFLDGIPFPIEKEELIVFQDQSYSCQIAHRITAQGWRMILLRPNAVFFPTLQRELPLTGLHTL